VVNAGDFLHASETRLELHLASLHDHDAFSRAATGSPEVVALMAANCWRQSAFRTEEVDRSGLSVIFAEDGGFAADICWEVAVHARDRSSQPNWSAKI